MSALADQSSDGEQQFQLLLEALPIAAYTCDAGGRLSFCNSAAEAVWGRSPDLRTGADRWTGALHWFSPISGRELGPDDSAAATAVRSGAASTAESIVERPNGSRVTVLARANPVRSATGAVTGAVCVLFDVTERRQIEIMQARLGAIVASSDDAIIGKTLDGVIVSWNEAAVRLFGYTSEEAIGRSITMIIPPDRLAEEVDILSRLVRGERIEHYETVRIDKQGRPLNISLTSSPIRDAQGTIVGASKIARDITERVRSQAQLVTLHSELRQADQAKNDFLATLAHELRNPLAPIRNLVSLLRNAPSPADELPAALLVIDRQLTQMTRLVDDLMDVSRISKNKFELRKERVRLKAVAEAAIELSQPLLAASEHAFTAEFPGDDLPIDADPTRLTQAIGNVLNNAAKYTEAGGRITLRAWRQGNEAHLRITDNGIGIPPEMVEQVFEMFVQVQSSTLGGRGGHGGLGVGLHLAAQLAEMHGGSLTATSGGLGQGSSFEFTLPLATGPVTTNDAAPQERARRRGALLRRVLVVDDNEDAANSVAKLLNAIGHTAVAVYDGPQALARGEEFQPELILLDIGLPGIDGYETARRIRQTDWGKSARLYALTGWGQEDARRKSKEAGFDRHLVKPIDPAAVLAADAAEPGR